MSNPAPTLRHSESKYPANTCKPSNVRLFAIRVGMGGEEAVIRSPAQLGQLVQALRRQRCLSQRELAQIAGGISQARMSALELHPERLTLDRLLLITAALDLELVVRPRCAPAPVAEW